MADRIEIVDIGDGYLEVELSGQGEPVLLIQTALTRHELRPLARGISRSGDLQVLHYHRRGYGGSSATHGPAAIEDETEDARALLRTMDVGPAHVIGVSYSAAIALALAGSSPEFVRTVCVVEPPPSGTPAAEQFQHANRTLLASFAAHGADTALDEFMTMLIGPDWREVSEREQPGSVAAMERDASTFFTRDVPALASWRLSDEDVTRIRCPALYVGGSQSSPWFQQMRDRLVALLPDAHEAAVEEAGHGVASTHPADVAQLISRHCRRDAHPQP